mmetsp:Transcript_25243/g.74226  ORF Transcript_25243/g.74226 Transcript_25243/m.74226 type:complete len:93 (+) Transcript_25243:691-969(+)
MLCDALWAEASKPVDEGGVGSELVQGEVVLLAYAENKSGYKEKKKKKVTGVDIGRRHDDPRRRNPVRVRDPLDDEIQESNDPGTEYRSAVVP